MLTDALRRLTRHSAVYALGPALQKLVGFLLLPFVTAWIGGTGAYGVVEMGGVTIAVAAQVLGVNVLHGMTRFYADARDERERSAFVSTTLWMLAATTGAALLAALAFPGLASRLLVGSTTEGRVAVVVFAILFAQTVGQVGLRWLQVQQRSGAYVAITTAKAVVEIGLKVALLLAGLGALGVLLSVLGGEALVALGLALLIAWKAGLTFSREAARKLLAYSLPLVLSGLLMFVLHQADRWFVQRLHGDAAVGVYGIAYKLGAMANVVLLEAFGLIWFPFVFAVQDEGEARLLVRKVTTYVALLFSVATLFLALFAEPIVRLMAAPEFAAASGPLPLIAFGYLAWAVFQVVHTGFYLRRRTGIVTWLVGGAAALNLALNALLVPSHGAMGAAWATCGTFAALAAAAWVAAERLWPVGFELGRVLAPVLLAAVLALAGTALPADWPPAAALGARAALLLALPLGLWSGGYLDPAEKSKIVRILADLRGRRGRAR